MRFLSSQNQSGVYGTENFITTCSLEFPFSCVPRLALKEASQQIHPEPHLCWLPDHLLPHQTGILLVCCCRKCKSWLLYELQWQQPPLIATRVAGLLATNTAINLTTTPYSRCSRALRPVSPGVVLKPQSFASVSISIEFYQLYNVFSHT